VTTTNRLQGFGPLSVFVALVLTALAGIGGLLVPVWAQLSETPWRALGFVRPRSWARTIALGVAAGVLFKLAMKAVVMPLLGAAPVNPAYHYLAGNAVALPGIIATMIVRAGFGEEALFRGFLFERLGRLLGNGKQRKVLIVLVTSLVFALAHLPDQGIDGAMQATITGLAFGTTYAITGRLWGIMAAHAAFDLTAVAMIYFNVEAPIAHLFYR
jgi:membrane protease YdiL (CAAX protease family)